ncbi:hypothetical protein JIN84_16915 [Luteolibacter yonseiensis]|uniref:Uncharacterized protein n=1 Tax=Luteolibacter yonseiensis TaxID=1144680 RepID=A0A934R5G2_9BACT|nr:hypothetical protein [Luteolibacter yonseiensis]MBK1817304.1 hypothetical protein [Luteolibacter yonseiensis]
MTSGPENSNRDHWQAKARKVARQVNLAWWLESLSAPLLVTALAGAAVLLVVRREITGTDPWILAACIAGAVCLIGLACWAWAAGKFEKPEQSMVRMEAAMQLRNALSAARAGVAPWPAPLQKTDAGLTWQWPRLLVPPLGALALLAAGLFIPVSALTTNPPSAPEQPQAWKQLDSELDHLAKEEVVDEKYLEDTRKRLDELKAQEEEQWFSHSSLEATDSLKKSHRAESGRVERELDRADKALANLEKNAGAANQAEKNRMMEEFDQALQGLQNGAMKPNPALLEQMKKLDLKGMANLSPEQIQQLRENLKKHSEAMKNGGQGEGEDWSDELLAGDGEGECEGEGKEGEGPGKGGIDRGPGHSPGVLGNEKEGVEIGALTGLEAKDLSRSTPGDLLELQDGEHEVDKSATSVTQGGNTEATGKGGDRVWRDALDPAEQRTLKRFFK